MGSVYLKKILPWCLRALDRVSVLLRAPAVFLTLLLLLFHGGSVEVGFLSDDHGLLEVDPQLAWNPEHSSLLFRPLGLTLLWGMKLLFAYNPMPYHLLALGLHLLNSYLVLCLGRTLGRPSSGLAAAVLFLCYRHSYESVYWISAAVFFLPMTGLVLAACLLDIRQRAQRFGSSSRAMKCLPTLIFILALLFHEIALALPLLMVVIAVSHPFSGSGTGWRSRLRSLAPRYWPMIVLGLAYALFKAGFGLGPSYATKSLADGAATFARGVWLSLLPFDAGNSVFNLLAVTTFGGFTVMIIACVWVYFSWRLMRSRRFHREGLAAIGLQICIAPFALMAWVQSRYLYLPAAFASILCANILAGLVRGRSGIPGGTGPSGPSASSSRIRSLAAFSIITIIIATQYVDLRQRLSEWKEATRISDRLLGDAREAILGSPGCPETVLLVNLPDGIIGGLCRAYIFRNGAPEALATALRETPRSGFEPACQPDIDVVRTAEARWTSFEEHRLVSDRDIREAAHSRGTLVLIFDSRTRSINQHPPPLRTP